MVEMITHLAFYSGWPNAWAVFNMLEDVYSDGEDINSHGGVLVLVSQMLHMLNIL